jgi:pSer/pThr/pTyr-binding forkhead associated (FHA) protein
MPLITLRYKGKVLQEYPINIGQTLTIGRNDSNDIFIDNLAVSGKHARIDSVSASFIITDLESTNGTFVNEELIASHGLRNNDVILIGKHELLFDRSDLEKKATDQNEETPDDKTRHLETAE